MGYDLQRVDDRLLRSLWRNAKRYRVAWLLPKGNPLEVVASYVVIFLATHGESGVGGVKLNYAEARGGSHQSLPIPVYSVEGNVENQSPRRIAFGQDPDQI